jgi:hypothetical protein
MHQRQITPVQLPNITQVMENKGWDDIIGNPFPKITGAGSPTLTPFRGGSVRWFAYAANDSVDMEFHIPHNYALGTDLYLHTHWAHDGTNISGTLGIDYAITYAKGHSQAIFPAEFVTSMSVDSLSIANTAAYLHRIDEIQLSAVSPTATQIDSDLIEPDGLIMVNLKTSTIPTITGGAGKPFILCCDVHYQIDRVCTLNKSPNFYGP